MEFSSFAQIVSLTVAVVAVAVVAVAALVAPLAILGIFTHGPVEDCVGDSVAVHVEREQADVVECVAGQVIARVVLVTSRASI